MNAIDDAARLRPTAVAFTNCHDASTFGRTVWLTPAETGRLRGLLATLQDWGLVLRAAIEPAVPGYGFDQAFGHLRASLGDHVVKAALAAGKAGPFPGSDPWPAAVMPVWAFEPEARCEDVLLSSARLWGADLLLEALRVEGDEEALPVPAVRERFARWAMAAGRISVAPVRLPGRGGSYAVFASPAAA